MKKIAADGEKIALVLWILLLLAIVILNGMVGDWGRLAGGPDNLYRFFFQSLWPPDMSVLEPQTYPVCTAQPFFDFTCSTAWKGVIETLKIAFVATVFGMVVTLPLSVMASRNLSPRWISYPTRFLISACRSLPALIWAIFLVILVGLGPLAGVLAMTIYTVGYLGKLQYESIEGLTKTPLDAANAIGLSRWEVAVNVVIPEAANDLISHSIFMFEYNFRSGTVIGIVGAGGIGYYIDLYLRFLQYDKVFAYLIIIYIVVLIIDFISIYARSFFTEEEYLVTWRWRDVFIPSWTQD